MKHNNRIKYIIYTYLLGMVVFTLFRVICTLVYCLAAETWPHFDGLLVRAFLVGLRFDTVVSCYLLALPWFLLLMSHFVGICSMMYHRILNILVCVGYIACFFACAADIPFFNYFFTRLNAVAANEAKSFGIIASMIFTEPRYIGALCGYVVAMVGYVFAQRAVFRGTLVRLAQTGVVCRPNLAARIALWIFGTALVFVGMRGGLGKRPIRISSANYCSNPVLNQLGLNPVFTLVKSASALNDGSRSLSLIDDDTAQRIYVHERHTAIDSTLAANAVRLPEGTNVVLIIMESMTAEKLGELTPNLNGIIGRSLCFTRAYSAGIHTYNGIYSTLYSTPGIPARHPMHRTFIPRMQGLPWVLHDNGYDNAFFVPHDEHYDNIEPFLYGNGFDSVVGQHSFDPAKVVGTWGVPDHVLFDYALAHCNRVWSHGPFFTTIITCSDHTPYIIPDGIDFAPKSGDIGKQMVEYADWSIGRFVEAACRQPWFDNTVFVFIADHGALWGTSAYEMALSYHHVPMIFYSPRHIVPEQCDRLALQIDLGPTLLGMLPLVWENETFGLDLMRQRRAMAYFSSDDKVGVLDDEYYYIYNIQEDCGRLYHYADLDHTDCSSQDPVRAQCMKEYGLGLIQQAQQLK